MEVKNQKPLTPKQMKVLDFLLGYDQDHGYAPSLQEIANFIGRSISSAQHFIEELRLKGYLEKNPNISRGISTRPNHQTIPLLGFIAAGNPIEPIEVSTPVQVPATIKINPSFSYYALKVRGDSMIDMGILDGDTIMIKHQLTAIDGDVVVAITEKGATLKVFRQSGAKITLEPRNSNFPKIIPKRIEIRGKFIGLIRS